MRFIFICFGLLDLLAFYRGFPKVVRVFVENYDLSDLTSTMPSTILLLLIVSLLISGPLTMLGKKAGYIIYYFQFPARLWSLTGLTFGFVFTLFPTEVGTLKQGMTIATVIAFEATRLMLTLQSHRKT